MQLRHYGDAHPYYLRKCAEILDGLRDCHILKTDLWNETRKEQIGTGDIVGSLPGRVTVVEINRARCEAVKYGSNVEVINADLREIEFKDSTFDGIVCLSTLNYMPFSDCCKVIPKFRRWLKQGGRLYIVAWLTWQENEKVENYRPTEHAGRKFDHNLMEFCSMLWDSGFDILEREEIFGSKATPMMVGYKCRRV